MSIRRLQCPISIANTTSRSLMRSSWGKSSLWPRALRWRGIRVWDTWITKPHSFASRHIIHVEVSGSKSVDKQGLVYGFRAWWSNNILVRNYDPVRRAGVANNPSAFPSTVSTLTRDTWIVRLTCNDACAQRS